MMTSTQFQILRLMITLGRPISFGEMVFYIGEDKFVTLWHDTERLVNQNIIMRWEDENAFLKYAYSPTAKGLDLHKKYEPDYRGLPFARPVQKEIS